LPWNVDPEIAAMMRTGDVAYERLRPIDTYSYWFARAMAWRLAATLLRSVPLILVTAIVFPLIGLGDWSLRGPAGVETLALFALSMAAVFLLSAAITTLLNISVVLMLTDQGINAITNPLVVILSGMIVPLPLFPDWAQGLLLAQPFAGLVDIPYRIYFGQLTGVAAVGAIALQIAWIISLIGLGRMLMARAMSRVHLQGG
jgi:ABC-2 type transport system permease protein